MELEDIDAWYEEKKEALTEKYISKLRKEVQKIETTKSKDSAAKKKDAVHDRLKREYLASMRRLHKGYELRSKYALSSGLEKHFLKHRLEMWKKKHLKFIDAFKERLSVYFSKKEKSK